VTLVDGSNSRQKELDAKATVADIPDGSSGVASAMTRKPRPSLNGLGFTFFGIVLVLPKESVLRTSAPATSMKGTPASDAPMEGGRRRSKLAR